MTNKPSANFHVLVVDDEPGICFLLAEALNRLGCTVESAHNRVAAMHLVETQTFDMAFIDLTLQDARGTQIVADAKLVNPAMFCIIMSGVTVESYKELIEHQVDDYISKPFSLDQIGYLVMRNQWRTAISPSQNVVLEAGHQLKTPLAVIKEFAHLTIEGKGGELTEKQQLYMSVIDENTDRALAQVRQLEQLHSAAPATVEQPEALAVHDLLESMHLSWQPIMESSKLTLLIESGPDLPPLLADRPSTEQILFNLLDNATKYAPPGSTVKLSASQAENGTISIEVADSGAGIPIDQRENVFTAYGRMPDHENSPGLGLGLTIALKLARQMSGDLVLSGEEGDGARFILRLPAVDPS